MKLSVKIVVSILVITSFFCITRGGVLSLAYAAEVPRESISSGITELITSSLGWINNTPVKILGWLCVGVPLIFVLCLVKKIVIRKRKGTPARRSVKKISNNKYRRNENGLIEGKRDLTDWEIRLITEEYGFTHRDNETRDGHKVYTSWIYAGLTWFGVYFCDDGVRTYKGLFSDETDFISYDELRNGFISMEVLKFRYKGFPHEFYTMLMELKEA